MKNIRMGRVFLFLQMANVFFAASNKIINTDNFMIFGKQFITEMRAYKTSTASY